MYADDVAYVFSVFSFYLLCVRACDCICGFINVVDAYRPHRGPSKHGMWAMYVDDVVCMCGVFYHNLYSFFCVCVYVSCVYVWIILSDFLFPYLSGYG